MAGLRVENVSKTIGATPILHDVSFEVADGSFYALLGPSGSGKTTILKTVSGFASPDSGRVLVDGKDVTGIPPHKRNLGVVFQNYALFPHLSVAANVEFGLRMRRVGKRESAAKVDEALALVGIDRLADRRPAQLSGGEQQRVALARALVIRPSLLLLDEPLSALDRKIRQELQVELKRVQQTTKITTIMVTHDQEEVQFLADELLVLESGHIRQIGRPADVYSRPSDAFVAGFMGASNVWRAVVKRGRAGVRAESTDLVVPIGDDSSVADGAPIIVSVRPEDVIVERGSKNGAPTFTATIDGISLVGALARLQLRIANHRLISLDLARAARELKIGSQVAVSIDPARVNWYLAEGEPRLS